MRFATCLFLALLAAAGCTPFPLRLAKQTPSVAAADAGVTRTAAPVTADQVNELNARSKALALQEELNRAAEADAVPAEGKPAKAH